jgi:hypothetical protein
MPGCPRKDVVAKGQVGVYHCWNRCVQRAFLCGKDPVTETDYEHRRNWIERIQQILAGLFAVEIAFHAELANHIHLILRTRPDVARGWDDRQVVRRWLILTKLKRNGNDQIVEPTEAEINKELNRPGRVEKLRGRLADVSWFMGTLCENISRRCNRESGTSGAFWEHRFECRNLADEAAILVCGIYIDLNQIRAGEALTPEQSRHTSAYNRIQGLRQRQARLSNRQAGSSQSPLPDGWLCELSLDHEGQKDSTGTSGFGWPWRASDKGLLSMSLEKYLELLDWTGREVRGSTRGAIPESLAPILDRLGINRAAWLEAVTSFDTWFGRVVGSVEVVSQAAKRAGRRWFRGKSRCTYAFG